MSGTRFILAGKPHKAYKEPTTSGARQPDVHIGCFTATAVNAWVPIDILLLGLLNCCPGRAERYTMGGPLRHRRRVKISVPLIIGKGEKKKRKGPARKRGRQPDPPQGPHVRAGPKPAGPT